MKENNADNKESFTFFSPLCKRKKTKKKYPSRSGYESDVTVELNNLANCIRKSLPTRLADFSDSCTETAYSFKKHNQAKECAQKNDKTVEQLLGINLQGNSADFKMSSDSDSDVQFDQLVKNDEIQRKLTSKSSEVPENNKTEIESKPKKLKVRQSQSSNKADSNSCNTGSDNSLSLLHVAPKKSKNKGLKKSAVKSKQKNSSQLGNSLPPPVSSPEIPSIIYTDLNLSISKLSKKYRKKQSSKLETSQTTCTSSEREADDELDSVNISSPIKKTGKKKKKSKKDDKRKSCEKSKGEDLLSAIVLRSNNIESKEKSNSDSDGNDSVLKSDSSPRKQETLPHKLKAIIDKTDYSNEEVLDFISPSKVNKSSRGHYEKVSTQDTVNDSMVIPDIPPGGIQLESDSSSDEPHVTTFFPAPSNNSRLGPELEDNLSTGSDSESDSQNDNLSHHSTSDTKKSKSSPKRNTKVNNKKATTAEADKFTKIKDKHTSVSHSKKSKISSPEKSMMESPKVKHLFPTTSAKMKSAESSRNSGSEDDDEDFNISKCFEEELRKRQANESQKPKLEESDSDTEIQSGVFYEDINTKDTELWMIRAPVGVDIGQLSKKEILLNGSQAVGSLGEEQVSYEIQASRFQQMQEVNLVALFPSKGQTQLYAGSDIQGQINLVQSVIYPPVIMPTLQPTSAKAMPDGLKPRFQPFGAGSPVQYRQKSKKLKRKKLTDSHEGKKKKKKKHRDVDSV